MIWHFLEVWVLLAGAFLIGCTMGAVLHDLVAQSTYAAAQGGFADLIGEVIDRLKGRFGVGPPVWRPRHRQHIIDHPAVADVYDESDYGDHDAGLRDAAANDVTGGDGERQSYEPADLDVDADWHDETEPVAEPVPPAHPVREALEPQHEPIAAPVVAAMAETPAGDLVSSSVPADGIAAMRPASLAEPRGGVPDNLQRIRGIGERNELRLNQLGVFHFGQIAAWTPAEMRWVAQHLAFPERIERDDWIGQAIVLASGGDTGFTKSAERRRARRHQEFRSPAESGEHAADDESAES